MKLRWLIIGTIVAVTGGVLVLKHFVDNEEKYSDYRDSESGKNVGEFLPDIYQPEFTGEDYLT
jgi:hypothetical protein